MDGKNAKQPQGMMFNEQQLKFEYSLAKYRNECVRNELWKQRNLLKRLRQQRDGVHNNNNNNHNNRVHIHHLQDGEQIDYQHSNHHDTNKSRSRRQQQTCERLSTERLVKKPPSISYDLEHRDINNQKNTGSSSSGNGGDVDDGDPLRMSEQSTKHNLMDRVKTYELRAEMESLQQTLKNMIAEYHALKKQRISIQDTVFDLENKIEMQRAHFTNMKRARSLPDVSSINLKSPTSSPGVSGGGASTGSNRILSARPKRKLPSIATSLRVKMSLIALRKRAQQKIEQRKREEHVPFPELSRRSAAKLK